MTLEIVVLCWDNHKNLVG